MIRIPKDWPKLVFILVPVLIVTVDATVLIHDRLQAETQKAIRLVKESSSRKENFTVQQYLYTTVYHRKSGGEALSIEGWRAMERPGGDAQIDVEFSYSDSNGIHVAIWEANLKTGKVTPENEGALDLAWH